MVSDKQYRVNLVFYFIGYLILIPWMIHLVGTVFTINEMLVTLIVPICCSGLLIYQNRKAIFEEGHCHIFKGILWGVLLFGIQWGINLLISHFFGDIYSGLQNSNQNNLANAILEMRTLALITTCVFIPVMEEIIFRYSVTKALRKVIKKENLVFILSVLIFCLMHCVPGMMRGNYLEILNMVFYLAPAWFLQRLYKKTGGIQTGAIAHITYNLLVLS